LQLEVRFPLKRSQWRDRALSHSSTLSLFLMKLSLFAFRLSNLEWAQLTLICSFRLC
ncbi:hypothetical protein FOC4_h10017346, partial [Fusarium odoratissimum]